MLYLGVVLSRWRWESFRRARYVKIVCCTLFRVVEDDGLLEYPGEEFVSVSATFLSRLWGEDGWCRELLGRIGRLQG